MVTPASRTDLWSRVVDVTARGLASGALLPIDTRAEVVSQGDLRFAVRVVASLRHKDAARQAEDRLRAAGRRDVNPFLPHDPALWVADLSLTHHALLNKFLVVPHHLLLVTRAFEPQERWLSLADFEALALALAQIDGLGFYNGGPEAGASQPHKHLQLVPLPLGDGAEAFPLAPLVRSVVDSAPTSLAALPFAHSIARLPVPVTSGADDTARRLWQTYARLIEHLGLGPVVEGGTQRQPYNLLVTRAQMWVVPRRQEHVAGISLNALAYAGALLVRDQAQLDALRSRGPLDVLAEAAGSGP